MKKFNFHYDNPPAHIFRVARAESIEICYELLLLVPYSANLAACDFFLFSNLQKWLAGQKF